MRQGLVVGLLLVGLWNSKSGVAEEPEQTSSRSTVRTIHHMVFPASRVEPESAPVIGPFPHAPLVQIVADSHVLFQWRPGSEVILDEDWTFEEQKRVAQRKRDEESSFEELSSHRWPQGSPSRKFIIGDGSPPITPELDPVFNTPTGFQYQPAIQGSLDLFNAFGLTPEAKVVQQESEVARQALKEFGWGSRRFNRESSFWVCDVAVNPFHVPELKVSPDGMLYREGTFSPRTE